MHKMNSRRVSFLFFAAAITVVAAQSASVSIWNTDVTLTCPSDNEVKWNNGKDKFPISKELTLKDYTDKNEGLYHCEYEPGEGSDRITQYFYIKAKATQARQPRGQTRGPPTPDPDYQPLNPATRANDVYAQAQPQPHRR